jgi:hypothetical protein
MTRVCLMAMGVFGVAAALSATERADRVVDAVLQREARQSVPRRADDLAGILDSSRARWAAGYVSDGDDWQPYDAEVAHVASDAAWQEYQVRRGTSALSPQLHLDLAQWCGEHGLRDQERAHLWALLVANPRQPRLWQRLGYSHVDGEWLTEQDERDRKQRRQQIEKDYRVWLTKAKSLAKRLSDPATPVQTTAREQLLAITDIAALPALESVLAPASQDAALDFVNWARKLNRVETTMALARQAVINDWEPVRGMAIEALRGRRFDHYVPILVRSLHETINHEIDLLNEPIRVDLKPIPFAYWIRYWGRSVEVRETFDAIVRREIVFAEGMPLSPEGERQRQARLQSILRPSSVADQLARRRADNDRARNITDLANQPKVISNEERTQSQIVSVVAQVANLPSLKEPRDCWNWWLNETVVDAGSPKPTIEASDVYWRDGPSRPFIRSSCLPAGTPIVTDAGLKAIDAVRVGDRVLSKDIVTGELAYRPVLHTTVRSPQPLKQLHTSGDTIAATLGHYFWVSGQGWRMTKELKPGDRLHGVSGTVSITDISNGPTAAVYNLVVERANTYFVGEARILSHDVTPPSPTNITVPGLAAR